MCEGYQRPSPRHPAGTNPLRQGRTHRGYLETWHRIDVWPDSVQIRCFGRAPSMHGYARRQQGRVSHVAGPAGPPARLVNRPTRSTGVRKGSPTGLRWSGGLSRATHHVEREEEDEQD